MTAPNATCPPDAVLADFGYGKIDAAGAESVNQHLETCYDCRQRVANLPGDSFVDRLRAARDAKRDDSAANFPVHPKPTEAWDGRAPREIPRSSNDGAIPPELASHRDYELLKELGRGGMGVVYLARNRMMDRLEVLKVLSKALLDRPGALERFQQEIRSAARLAHPNIVAAYSVLQPGDLLVFAMEYVRGQDLSQVVKARGQLPVANAAFYTHQVALGLQHAHEKGMVHRDIKPNNLMLTVDGKKHVVKTLDFGLSKATSENGAEAALTKSGQILGTPDYVAPEQTLAANKADIRADIYSLGCTLYHLLSGGPPFQESSLYGILEAHQKRDPRPLNLVRPDVPVELAAVVTKMMAKVPAKRYQTPAEVARALAPFFKPGQSVATPSPADEAQSHPAAETAQGSGAATSASPMVPPTVALPIPVAPHPLVVAAPTPDFRANAAGKFSAELRLAELAASYAAKGDRRHLPSCWQWIDILLFTRRHNWTPPGRRLMRAAAKYHGLRLTGLLAAVALAVSLGPEAYHWAQVRRAETLAESLFTDWAVVPLVLDRLRSMGRLALPYLRAKFDDQSAPTAQRLRAAYALAELGEAPRDFLLENVATAPW
ncbi:MAG TPA: protein kinase, partial [Pirellulales bacterium]|nr:protein kinase [Pirellulales bacterium]